MNDMRKAIVPKSDQLNADDLIAGPITIKVEEVTIRGGQEQPVSIHYEGDEGKPYKPCKSMSRVMVAAWGPDASVYVGRSMTLYRDSTVKWGGMEVGGIRISHLSHIDSAMNMALTVTKGSRKSYTVRVLEGGPDWKKLLNEAATLDDLQATWRKVPKDQKPGLEGAKDARKTALTAPATAGSSAPAAAPLTFAAVAEALNDANTLAELDEAEKSIALVADVGQQVELKERADQRRAQIGKTAPE